MKNELRKTVLAQLTSQDPETKAKIDQYLLEQLIALPAYKDAQVIATYLSFPHEYDTGLARNMIFNQIAMIFLLRRLLHASK